MSLVASAALFLLVVCAYMHTTHSAVIEMMNILDSSCTNFQPVLEMKTFLLISKLLENWKYLWSLYLHFEFYISEVFYSFEYRNKH